MIELINIAHVGSTQGKLGALKIFPKEHLEEALLGAEFLFFRINGSKVPFSIKKINTNNDPWLLYLDDVSEPELASSLSNSDVFLESSAVDETVQVAETGMKGFQVISSEGENFGIVKEVEEHPQQILLLVEWQNKEYRIPFHTDLIEDLDQVNKKVVYTYSAEALKSLM